MSENIIYLVLTETEALVLKEAISTNSKLAGIMDKLEEELSNLYEAEAKIMEDKE